MKIVYLDLYDREIATTDIPLDEVNGEYPTKIYLQRDGYPERIWFHRIAAHDDKLIFKLSGKDTG